MSTSARSCPSTDTTATVDNADGSNRSDVRPSRSRRSKLVLHVRFLLVDSGVQERQEAVHRLSVGVRHLLGPFVV
jgi:hypothetical protein